MPLQFKNIAVGNLQDDVSGNNYAANKAVYILNLNNTLAQIYSDEAGTTLIVQDGVNNVTGARGVFGFWVEAGDYFVQVGANKYRVSITGADYFNNRVDETVNLIVDSVAGRGAYYPVGSFEAGFTYTDINQVGTFGGTDYYIYTGGLTSLPHAVTAGTNPTLSSDYAQVFYGEIDNVQGLRNELDDRALYLTLAEAQASDLREGQYVRLVDRGGLWKGTTDAPNNLDIVDIGSGLSLRLQSTNGVVTAKNLGYTTEVLQASTQEYKSVVYDVQRWTQTKDFLPAINRFIDMQGFHTLDIEDMYLYVSNVSVKQWIGKRITGSGGKSCGFIKGSINWSDGTKSAFVDNIGFYGEISYMSLPLPVTLDHLLQNDANYFWYLDDISFGFGFGALGVATASSEGNTSGILVENCYFEMRDAVISGGSAPNDEDRPKAHHITFRNNETKGIMFHGAASIHFRYFKACDNHFYEHYCGYACDFSLGTQDSEFYNNTGDRLAAGFKSEPRSFDGSFRNKFYDNRLTTRWRWEGTGAAFNIIFRTKGREVEAYNNTITCFDFTPIDNTALNLEGISTDIRDNKFYIKGVPNGLSWFSQIKNGIDVPTAGQRLLLKNNEFHNETLVTINAGLQITSVNNDTFSNIDVDGNKFYGNWTALVAPEFGTVGAVVSKLSIVNNTFPNTALFKPASAFTFVDIDVIDNKVDPKDSANIVSLSFITVTGEFNALDNKVTSKQGGTNTVSLVVCSTNTGSLANCNITLSNNKLSTFTGSLLYLFSSGANVSVGDVVINSNSVRWEGSSAFTNFVLAKGASTFAMNGNTLINKLDTAAGFIGRPTDGADSKYQFNTVIGNINDDPS